MTPSKRQKTDLYLQREKEEKYHLALLTPCLGRDEKEYQQVLEELFLEELSSLKEIFAPQRFEDRESRTASEQYRFSLYKLFIELLERKQFSEWKDCEATFTWLAKEGVEKVLEKRREMKILHFFVLRNNRKAVQWVFKHYTPKQKEEALAYENGKIFRLLVLGNGDDQQVEIINLVLQQFRQLFSNEEEQEVEVEKKKERLKLFLGEHHEEGRECWEHLAACLL